MNKRVETEVKVGVFVSLGIALVMLAILLLGSTENLLQRKRDYTIHFPNVEGLIQGAKVVLGGVQIGTVQNIGFDQEHHDVQVQLSILKDASRWIHQDATAEIATQGVLGDKFISINPGTTAKPELAAGSDIPNAPSQSLTQFLNNGDQLLVNLNSLASHLDYMVREFNANDRSATFFQGMAVTAKNLSTASDKLNREMDNVRLKKIMINLEQITEKINGGTGTIGELVNDPGLYDSAKALVGEANRNRIVRNLVRRTIRQSEEEAIEQEQRKQKK